MNIIYSEVSKQFHLFNEEVSYIFKVLHNGHLCNLYYGSKLNHKDDFKNFYFESDLGATSYINDESKISFEYIRQEYSTFGCTDFTEGSYEIVQKDESYITDFKYKSHKIYDGKNKISNGDLPATFSNGDVKTLEVTLFDDKIGCELVLNYSIFKNKSVIARSTVVKSLKEEIKITRLMSSTVDFEGDNFELLQLEGAWIRERHIEKSKLRKGKQSIYSLRGCSSPQHNPFFALGKGEIKEYTGEVYGFNFVYSGNFLAEIDVNHYSNTRVNVGIHPFKFEANLKKGEVFETPEVILSYSNKGLNGLSQTNHKLIKENLMKNYELPPIVINNWEATYFDFDEQKLLNLAKKAKEIGVETFVLDDGWFGRRNDATSSLGDWYVNENKLPNGITGLCKKINDLGMNFGLWIEPEMVNKESELYKQKPDWAIQTPNRNMSQGRNQYVLDFANDEVVEYIYEKISNILNSCNISYVKWDMNRHITEGYSKTLQNQGLFYHKYILGVYKLMRKLTEQFPKIMFENCSSGGGRFDLGMLYYSPQIWTSDNTDPVDRLNIQEGTSIAYPLRAISNHISVAPNHQTGRKTPISMRANVAYFGCFGYELDLTKNDENELKLFKSQIEFYKKYRNLIIEGDFYRTTESGIKNNYCWQVVSKDKKESIVGAYQIKSETNELRKVIKLVGLNKDTQYCVTGFQQTFFGDELMNVGIPITKYFNGVSMNFEDMKESVENEGVYGICDYSSQIFLIKAI